jgi:hypothetical protein
LKIFSLNEIDVIKWMINFYCVSNHKGEGICSECTELLNYAIKRNENCPHGLKNKPVCSVCEIHCYKDSYRERIREVMKFSGPRILFKKPVYGIKYLIRKKIISRYKTKKPSK